MDNGPVNNVEPRLCIDSAIYARLIERGGLDILSSDTIGVCAEFSCRFLASVAFPESVTAGLRVGELGDSSVRYEIALFRENGEALTEGSFVHVFVDREDRRREAGQPRLKARSRKERLPPGGHQAGRLGERDAVRTDPGPVSRRFPGPEVLHLGGICPGKQRHRESFLMPFARPAWPGLHLRHPEFFQHSRMGSLRQPLPLSVHFVGPSIIMVISVLWIQP